MSKYFKKLSGLGLALGLAIGAASGANATVTYKLNSASMVSDRSETGTVISTTPAVNTGAGIGELNITLQSTAQNSTAFTWQSFCVDIGDDLVANNGDLWSISGNMSVAQLASALTLSSTRANLLYNILYTADSYMSTDATGTGSSNDRGAAVQIAIWEVMNETGTGFDAGTGSFKVSGLPLDSGTNPAFSLALADANSLIQLAQTSSIMNSTGFSVRLVSSAGNQTQVVYSGGGTLVSNVPEPATWGMMVLGFGALGATLRRKRAVEGVIA